MRLFLFWKFIGELSFEMIFSILIGYFDGVLYSDLNGLVVSWILKVETMNYIYLRNYYLNYFVFVKFSIILFTEKNSTNYGQSDKK